MKRTEHRIKLIGIKPTARGTHTAEIYVDYAFHAVQAQYNPLFGEWYFDYKGNRYFIANNGKLIKSAITY